MELGATRIILNADDLGLTPSCTEAILEAFRQSYISSATLVANGPCVEDAARRCREAGLLDRLGIHLNLTEGTPLTRPIQGNPRFCDGQGLLHGPRNLRSMGLPAGIARQYNMAAAGQRCGETVKGLAPHDHRLAHGQRLEVFEVSRQVPRQASLIADYAVIGAGIDQERFGTHSSINRVTWPIFRPGLAAALP